jgi:hypothetical protein
MGFLMRNTIENHINAVANVALKHSGKSAFKNFVTKCILWSKLTASGCKIFYAGVADRLVQ